MEHRFSLPHIAMALVRAALPWMPDRRMSRALRTSGRRVGSILRCRPAGDRPVTLFPPVFCLPAGRQAAFHIDAGHVSCVPPWRLCDVIRRI